MFAPLLTTQRSRLCCRSCPRRRRCRRTHHLSLPGRPSRPHPSHHHLRDSAATNPKGVKTPPPRTHSPVATRGISDTACCGADVRSGVRLTNHVTKHKLRHFGDNGKVNYSGHHGGRSLRCLTSTFAASFSMTTEPVAGSMLCRRGACCRVPVVEIAPTVRERICIVRVHASQYQYLRTLARHV